jgi:hypothetical protein
MRRGPHNICPDHNSQTGQCPALRCEFGSADERRAWLGLEASWLSPQIDWPGKRSLGCDTSRARRLNDPVPAAGSRHGKRLRCAGGATGSMSNAVDACRYARRGKTCDAGSRAGGATDDASSDGTGALDPIPNVASGWLHALTRSTDACVANNGCCLNREFHGCHPFEVKNHAGRFGKSSADFQKQSRQLDHPFDARQATPPAMSPDRNNAPHLMTASPHFHQSHEGWTPWEIDPTAVWRTTAEA